MFEANNLALDWPVSTKFPILTSVMAYLKDEKPCQFIREGLYSFYLLGDTTSRSGVERLFSSVIKIGEGLERSSAMVQSYFSEEFVKKTIALRHFLCHIERKDYWEQANRVLLGQDRVLSGEGQEVNIEDYAKQIIEEANKFTEFPFYHRAFLSESDIHPAPRKSTHYATFPFSDDNLRGDEVKDLSAEAIDSVTDILKYQEQYLKKAIGVPRPNVKAYGELKEQADKEARALELELRYKGKNLGPHEIEELVSNIRKDKLVEERNKERAQVLERLLEAFEKNKSGVKREKLVQQAANPDKELKRIEENIEKAPMDYVVVKQRHANKQVVSETEEKFMKQYEGLQKKRDCWKRYIDECENIERIYEEELQKLAPEKADILKSQFLTVVSRLIETVGSISHLHDLLFDQFFLTETGLSEMQREHGISSATGYSLHHNMDRLELYIIQAGSLIELLSTNEVYKAFLDRYFPASFFFQEQEDFYNECMEHGYKARNHFSHLAIKRADETSGDRKDLYEAYKKSSETMIKIAGTFKILKYSMEQGVTFAEAAVSATTNTEKGEVLDDMISAVKKFFYVDLSKIDKSLEYRIFGEDIEHQYSSFATKLRELEGMVHYLTSNHKFEGLIDLVRICLQQERSIEDRLSLDPISQITILIQQLVEYSNLEEEIERSDDTGLICNLELKKTYINKYGEENFFKLIGICNHLYKKDFNYLPQKLRECLEKGSVINIGEVSAARIEAGLDPHHTHALPYVTEDSEDSSYSDESDDWGCSLEMAYSGISLNGESFPSEEV